jgi:hypothetical protein
MKRLVIVASLAIPFLACNPTPAEHNTAELDQLRSFLLSQQASDSFPIYADPPSGDYEELRKGEFLIQDSAKLELIKKYRTQLEPLIIAHVDTATRFVYLAAYLQYQSAVPVLKKQLLNTSSFDFYGWEGGDPTADKTAESAYRGMLDDHQYPYAMARIAAIEYISGKPLPEAAPLTMEEEITLTAKSASCIPDSSNSKQFEESCKAYWLLSKLKGQQPSN